MGSFMVRPLKSIQISTFGNKFTGEEQMGSTRKFAVGGKTYEVTGVQSEDHYLKGITKHFEPQFQSFCAAFLPKDAVAIDIGANIGATAIILGHYLTQGVVYAVEPGKTIYSLLNSNLQNNKLENIVALNCAVSDKNGQLSFVENSAFGHIELGKPSDGVRVNSVAAHTLDDLVESLKIERLDLIKIDVEGFERQVLDGGNESLRRFNPLIYLEFNSWCMLDHLDSNPLHFARHLMATFSNVYRVNKKAGARVLLEKMESARTLVHDNVVLNESIDDLVVSNNTIAIEAGLAKLNELNGRLSARINQAISEKAHKVSKWLRSKLG